MIAAFAGRVFAVDQELQRRREIVEHVLLVRQIAGTAANSTCTAGAAKLRRRRDNRR